MGSRSVIIIISLFLLPIVAGMVIVPADGANYGNADSPWPKARCDAENTGRSPYSASHNDGTLRWTFETEGRIRVSPVIGPEGNIYFSSEDGNFYALDPDGNELWHQEVKAVEGAPAIGRDGTIYVMSWAYDMYVFRSDGTLIRTMEEDGNTGIAFGKEGELYFADRPEGLIAITPMGMRLWVNDSTTWFHEALPAVRPNGNLVFGHEEYRNLTEYDPDGNVLWEVLTRGLINSATTLGPDGTTYIASYTFPGGHLEAFDTAGERLWYLEFDEWIEGGPIVSPDGDLVVITKDGFVRGVSQGGEELWTMDVGANTWGDLVCSQDGTVFVGCTDGNVSAIKDGEIRWRFQAGDNVACTPAIDADGIIYFGSNDGKLYAVGKERTVVDDVVDDLPIFGNLEGPVLLMVIAVVLLAIGGSVTLLWARSRAASTRYHEEDGSDVDMEGRVHSMYDQERPGQLPPPT
jgi:outer membrane protein assembly factor BamB